MKPDHRTNLDLDTHQGQEARTSSLAILTLVLSVANIPLVFCGAVPYLVAHDVLPHFVVPFMPVPAILLGCIALIAVKRSKGKRRGKLLIGIGLAVSFAWMGFWSVLIHGTTEIRKRAYEVKQRAQLRSIDTAIGLFNSEFEQYPPSDAKDEAGVDYCGAMKLCEAVMGQDLLGCHPESIFRSDGTDGKGKVLYPESAEVYRHNITPRKGPYLPLDNANAYALVDLYGQGNMGSFDPNHFVLCDVFRNFPNRETGKIAGMPILYYKADMSKTTHDVNDPNNPENIYNYRDNHTLLALGVPGKPGVRHPMYEDPKIFYEITKNHEVIMTETKPYRADTYILLSAGPDGLYGTPDDIANFEWKWKGK